MLSVRSFCLKEELGQDLEKTIRQLKDIGYEGFEPLLVFDEKQGKKPANLFSFERLAQLKPILDDCGMVIPTAHAGIGFGNFFMPTKKIPGYAKWLQKMGDKLWCVYLEWAEGSFIELFSIIGASKRRIPGKRDLNYTHYSLEVEDLKAFREAIIARGGAKYIETPIVRGMDNALQMWMHDPDGNRFELMEYLPDAMQLVGGPVKGV